MQSILVVDTRFNEFGLESTRSRFGESIALPQRLVLGHFLLRACENQVFADNMPYVDTLDTHWYLTTSPFPQDKYPSLNSLWPRSISIFSHNALNCAGLAAGVKPIPVELRYKDQVYQGLYKVLGHKILVESEWSGSGS